MPKLPLLVANVAPPAKVEVAVVNTLSWDAVTAMLSWPRRRATELLKLPFDFIFFTGSRTLESRGAGCRRKVDSGAP